MHLLCSGCCGVSGGLGLPRGPSDADLAPICQTVSDLRPARATRHRKSTALFSCFLLLPVSTVTASHPHIPTSLHYSTNHTVIWDHSYFSWKNPRLLFHCTIVKEVPALRLFLHSSPIHVLKRERDNNTLFVRNTDIKLVSYFSHPQYYCVGPMTVQYYKATTIL